MYQVKNNCTSKVWYCIPMNPIGRWRASVGGTSQSVSILLKSRIQQRSIRITLRRRTVHTVTHNTLYSVIKSVNMNISQPIKLQFTCALMVTHVRTRRTAFQAKIVNLAFLVTSLFNGSTVTVSVVFCTTVHLICSVTSMFTVILRTNSVGQNSERFSAGLCVGENVDNFLDV